MGQKIIIADNYAVFRAGIARFLAVEDEFSIVGQCDDLHRLYKAIESSQGAVVVFANSLEPSLSEMLDRASLTNTKFVAVLDTLDSPEPFLRNKIQGIVYRDVSRMELLRCLRTVVRGGNHVQETSKGATVHLETDMVGERARNRLSRKEL